MRIILILIIACFQLCSTTSFAATHKSIQEQLETSQSDIRQLKYDVKTAAGEIEVLRRDQVNYRTEKDILKEAYSSNLQVVNIVLAIVLGFGGLIGWFLGYLGIKSIKEIKANYDEELLELKALRISFQDALNKSELKQKELEEKFVNSQNEFDKKIGVLTSTNEEQNSRLKVLELIEKINGYMEANQWEWALEHIAVALDIDKDNSILWGQKALCHGKLNEFSKAVEASKKTIDLELSSKEKVNITNVVNMLEYLALDKQPDEFKKYFTLYKNNIEKKHDGKAAIYLNALMLLMNNDLNQAIQELKQFAEQFKDEECNKFLGENWSTDEVIMLASTMPAGKQRELVERTALFFNGKINAKSFRTNLVI